jgi:formylglycine-generating enzyme required for sulfatase activity/tRNA A-37 threonylcarbamoyl transferase component Bud32
LDQLIAEYLRRIDQGERVDVEAFLAPHPDLAGSFREYLRGAAVATPELEPLSVAGMPGKEAGAGTQSRVEQETLPPGPSSLVSVPAGANRPASPAAGPRGKAADKPAIPERLSRYRIVKLLGQGAMGAVYLAEDTELQRQVALKVPKFAQSDEPELLERFYREARAAATLHHPNICAVHDIGEDQGTRFIAMGYISGPPLSALVGTDKLKSERTAVKLARKIALALAAAHAKGIVHRDLKPANIMLDEQNEPVITDFGLARRTDTGPEAKLTQDGTILGTPAYMSPEQISGDSTQVGPLCDVYSLGVILYELLTGELPYRGSITAVLGQIIQGKPKRPSEWRPDLDKRLEAICLKMMAHKPQQRYASAAEAATALAQWLTAAPAGQAGPEASKAPAPGAVPAPVPLGKRDVPDAEHKLQDYQEQIVAILKQCQFSEALVRLEKLTHVQGPGTEPYVAWAQQELTRLKALPPDLVQKGPTLVAEAIRLLAQQNFAQVIRLLEQIPAEYRPPEAASPLQQARDLQKEVEELNEKMKQAVRERRYDGLRDRVLRRLLEIEPGNLVARDIFELLGTYGPGEALRFGKDGALLPAPGQEKKWKAGPRRPVYQRVLEQPARAKTPSSDKSTWSRKPLVAIASGLAALALLCFGIVLIIRNRSGEKVAEIKIPDGASIEIVQDGKPPADAKMTPDKPTTPAAKPVPTATKPSGPVVAQGQAPTYTAWPFDAAEAARRQNETAKALGLPKETTLDLGKGVTLKLVLIPAGSFVMGTRKEDFPKLPPEETQPQIRKFFEDSLRDEAPSHPVTISRPFYMAVTEVTQAQYEAVSGRNPSKFKGASLPVEGVSWDDATEFCRKLSGTIGRPVRLPTEAEWEYACRAGTATAYCSGDDPATLGDCAWFKPGLIWNLQEPWTTHPVGQKKANAFGLCDMHGNAGEWCMDRFGSYDGTAVVDPQGPERGSQRVVRNGGAGDPWYGSRSARRLGRDPALRAPGAIGFRVIVETKSAGTFSAAAPAAGLATGWPFDAAEAARRQAETAKALGLPKETTLDLGKGVTLKLMLIPAGSFVMGTRKEDLPKLPPEETDPKQRSHFETTMPDETPSHPVTISRPFYMAVTEVTQAQYEAVSGRNPSKVKGATLPVDDLSWDDATEFCRKLSGKTGRAVRLPTEAEWEYACRAGTATAYCSGDDPAKLSDYAWFAPGLSRAAAEPQTIHPVGQKKPNAFGLCDMHGNVVEWCQDWFGPYDGTAAVDPRGPATGNGRVIRGGNVGDAWWSVRSARRFGRPPAAPYPRRGFRVVLETQQAAAPPPNPTLDLDLGQGVTAKLALIPAGSFLMGSSPQEVQALAQSSASDRLKKVLPTETPQHQVTITRPFYMGIYEVTQAQYAALMGSNPSSPQGATLPVANVSWDEAVEFCKRLSAKTARTVRLPTEAEWEYACRAGTNTRFYFGDDETQLGQYGWYQANSNGAPQPVGQKKPNAFGLYDMHGNVWEMCGDWFADSYANATNVDPRGPASGSERVNRSGGYLAEAAICRAATRGKVTLTGRVTMGGFRVVVEIASSPNAQAAVSPPAAAAPGAKSSGPAPPLAIAPFDAAKAKEHQAAWAQHLGVPVESTNSIGMRFVLIPPGEFDMGSTEEAVARVVEETKADKEEPWYPAYLGNLRSESPRHRIRISKPFYLGLCEVTQAEYQRVIGSNPSKFQGDPTRPVEQVTWDEALAFCRKLGGLPQEQAVHFGYRLPSEAEWEYACRAGTTTTWYGTDDEAVLKQQAWFDANAQQTTHPVRQKTSNAWGLYDMHGNAWEWCADWCDKDYYAGSPSDDPKGPSSGSGRVFRGGSWDGRPRDCRSSFRNGYSPGGRYSVLGFRVARSPSD